MSTSRSSSISRWSKTAGALLTLVILSACAGERASGPTDPVGKLYARAFDEITDLYIEPITGRQLAAGAAAQLSRLDKKIAVAEDPTSMDCVSLKLTYDGHVVGTYRAAAVGEPEQWGRLIANVVAAAKQVSPQLAAMPEETIDKAIFDGATGRLDRFSRYATPAVARDQRAARDGFGGIGVTLDAGEDFRITAVTPGGPAALAGLKPDDRLTAIDGMPTAGRPQNEVIHQLRGPLFSAVSVTVARAGVPSRQYQLKRALVIAPTVTMTRNGNIAVLRIASFNQSTTQRLAEALLDAQRQAGGHLAGIVLDLRGNPGGLLDQAVSLADLFVREGPIVSTVGRHPASKQFFAASGDSIAPKTPIAVLINGGSASAAEIVAAALQDVGRAVVVGSSSYGKGSVQTVIRLPNDGELTLTWARLVSPSGYYLQTHGVVPTLCTADLDDDDRSLPAALERAGAASRTRSGLDERAWSELRRACPGKQTSPSLDVKLAERVLADPKLYSDASRAARSGAQVARSAAATEASLTGPDGALSSSTRVP